MFQIVKATSAMCEDVFLLNEEFNGPGCTTPEEMRTSLDKSRGEIVFIAYQGEEPAGFICGQVQRSVCYREPTGEITELYVRPSMRGRQLGAQLIRWLECALQTAGVRHIRLLTGHDNMTARHVYEKAGYTVENEVFYEKRLDAYSMDMTRNTDA